MNIALILLLNLAVGACIGLTGIAGFLLPMFYTGFLGMPAAESLALSFSAFLISGILGAVTYYKAGNLAVRPAVVLSAGSLLGALAGVRINLLIPEDVMQIILYAVVLISGVSILLRRGGILFPAGDRDGSSLRGVRSRRPGPCDAAPHSAGISRAHGSGDVPFQFRFYRTARGGRISLACVG